MPILRATVPRTGIVSHGERPAHRRDGSLRLPPRIQQHRGHDPPFGTLPTSHPFHQQAPPREPKRSGHGPPRRQRKRLHRPLQTSGEPRGRCQVRRPLQQSQGGPLGPPPPGRLPAALPRRAVRKGGMAPLQKVRTRLRRVQAGDAARHGRTGRPVRPSEDTRGTARRPRGLHPEEAGAAAGQDSGGRGGVEFYLRGDRRDTGGAFRRDRVFDGALSD
mmetsp:Transcript_5719/g.12068  ORF Transcript_5719/g.12068 Transcript_5719/m.12068 type:complete len:218 (+) Transcript_5719:392-1045(+)